MVELQENYLDKYNPWLCILEATAFVVQNEYHKMLQAIAVQLLFVRDMILMTGNLICEISNN